MIALLVMIVFMGVAAPQGDLVEPLMYIPALDASSIRQIAEQYAQLDHEIRRVRLICGVGCLTGISVAGIAVYCNAMADRDSDASKAVLGDTSSHTKCRSKHRSYSLKECVLDGAYKGVQGGFYAFCAWFVWSIMQRGSNALTDFLKFYCVDNHEAYSVVVQKRAGLSLELVEERLALILNMLQKEVLAGDYCRALFDLAKSFADYVMALRELIAFYQYRMIDHAEHWGLYDDVYYSHEIDAIILVIRDSIQQLLDDASRDSYDGALHEGKVKEMIRSTLRMHYLFARAGEQKSKVAHVGST